LVAHTRRIMPLSNFFTTMVAKSPQLDCPICNWVLTPCHGTYPPFLVLHIPMAGYNFICWRIFLGQIPIVVGQILVSTPPSLSRQMPFPSHKFLLLGCFQRRHFDLNNPILQSNPPNHVDFSHLYPFNLDPKYIDPIPKQWFLKGLTPAERPGHLGGGSRGKEATNGARRWCCATHGGDVQRQQGNHKTIWGFT
jgi:hypothetical protein